MISYHPDVSNIGNARKYWLGFRVVDTNDVQRLAKGLASFTCSGIIWRDGRRHSDNFLRADWLFLDFDTPVMTLSQAVENYFADSVHIIGTSRSHQKEKGGIVCDRFRVGLLLEEPIVVREIYVATARHYIDKYEADPACKDAARYFWPIKVVSVQPEGFLTNIIQAPPYEAKPPPERYREHGIVRRRTLLALRQVFPAHERNNLCFQAAKDLCDAGYSFQEIYDVIVNSPTYGGKVAADLAEEIAKCVRSGIKSVTEGRAYGRCEGSEQGAEETQQGRENPADGTLHEHHREDERGPNGCA